LINQVKPMRRLQVLMTVVLLVELAGCGGDGLKRVPVRGKITANGLPLDNASISFVPRGETKGEGGFGRSDEDGNFALTEARTARKGIIPGEYKVCVSRPVGRDGTPLPAGAKQAETPGMRDSLPREYASPENTPLQATVPETGGTVNLEVPLDVLKGK
jgi:hypothetical protein